MVKDWDTGTTEPGSSGFSTIQCKWTGDWPIARWFSSMWQTIALIGTDVFSTSWNDSENSAKQLQVWLDADETGETEVDGLEGGPAVKIVPILYIAYSTQNPSS